MLVDATRAASEACHRVGSRLVFFSTDYVFDGSNGPFGEADPVGPLNVYGQHKLEAEGIVLVASQGNLVIRTCQVFGLDPRRMNFVLRTADRLAAVGDVEVADNLFGTPTFAPDLVATTFDLLLGASSGIWHVAGQAFLSRYDLAVAVARAFRLDPALVRTTRWDEAHDRVNRPRRGGLRTDKLNARGGPDMTSLEDALAALRDLAGAS